MLTKNGIRHENSCTLLASPKRDCREGWRTLYEMSRCMLLDSKLQDRLWNYIVQTRNLCYSNRAKKTPYEMLTGKKPNVKTSQIWILMFCLQHTKERKVGFQMCAGSLHCLQKNSLGYLVYFADTEKVRHRSVKFTNKTVIEKET